MTGETRTMHITIDTSNITDADRAVLALVLEGYDGSGGAATVATTTETPANEPKRARRTKLEIAFDAAKEVHDADPTELAALVSAAEDLKAKDPQNERLKDFDPADYQPTPASEDAESDAATKPDKDGLNEFSGDSITIEQVTELATQLIQKNRSAMVELLKQFGARRVSEIPESDLGKFASEIRTKLA